MQNDQMDVYSLLFEISSLIADSCYTKWEHPGLNNPIGQRLDAVLHGISQMGSGLDDSSCRRVAAAGLFRDGDSVSGFPGISHIFLKALEARSISVYSIHNGLPPESASDVLVDPKNWRISSEDASKIRDHILPDKLKASLRTKKENGRYTLEDAADLLEDNELLDKILDSLKSAALEGGLPTFWPGKNELYKYGPPRNVRVREYFEEIYWNDLNKWLEEHELSIQFRFPSPEIPVVKEATKETAPPSVPSRVGWQVALFAAWPQIRSIYGIKPTAREAINWLKEYDTSGTIVGKNTGSELFWKTNRGEAKEVSHKTVENVLSKWRQQGRLPPMS